MINVKIANENLKSINLINILKNLVNDEEFKEVDDINDAQIVFIANYDEYKKLNNEIKNKENFPHYFFIWQSHLIADIESFSKDGDFRFLRGYFLIDSLENDDFFKEAVKDAIKKIRKREKWHSKQSEILSQENNYRVIGQIVKYNKNPEDIPRADRMANFETLFFDKNMFKVMQAINAIVDDRKEIFERIIDNYWDIINKLKNPEKEIFTNGELKTDKIKKILVDRKDTEKLYKMAPLLLQGETGVGKTLIARWLYKRLQEILMKGKKGKSLGHFIEVNASSFSSNLLETELFGYCKGTFTGADRDKIGLVFLAFGGILFVDEIGDMPLDVQTKFLKFLEEKIFVPEGWQSPEYIYCPVFIVAATNKDLKQEVEKGNFRKDLYARFIDKIEIPSLNERRASIIPIVDFYLQKELRKNSKISKISKEALNKFKDFDYSDGNFRFFEMLIKRIINKTKKYGLEVIIEDVVDEIYKKVKKVPKE